MTDRLDLDQLRKVAEKATPEPWRWDDPDERNPTWRGSLRTADWEDWIDSDADDAWDNGFVIRSVALHGMDSTNNVRDADAEFIATFDPPTVLALLAMIEEAHRLISNVPDGLDLEPNARRAWLDRVETTP